LAKAAMTERFSRGDNKPNEMHNTLYANWARGGAGLLITGNTMVEPKNLESAGNVVVSETALPELKAWANSATQYGNHCWTQISHSGRQTTIMNNISPVAPSAVKLKRLGFFAKPIPLTDLEIDALIDKYANAALISKKAGFTGIQIHAAHGYLISQFLSPLTNLRGDKWGGTIENRARFLFDVIKRSRKLVGNTFPISVKINSSDFQKGGFTEDESQWVIRQMEELGIDLLEISGGTYENAVFLVEEGLRESTRKREAYFIEFAKKVKSITSVPVMVTGGIRSLDFCNEAIKEGSVDVVGIARPFLLYENFAGRFLQGEINAKVERIRTGIKNIEDFSEAGYYNLILERMGKGKRLRTDYSPTRSAMHLILHEFKKAMANKFN
jgi:2,4-dienoyl-CoA reductase-like NADH-dependent reductase (Old Yellow Enzyme family)